MIEAGAILVAQGRPVCRRDAARASPRSGSDPTRPMSVSMIALLVHSTAVPAASRRFLCAALHGPVDAQTQALQEAGRIILRETDLTCDEVKDLLALSYGCLCDGSTPQGTVGRE